MPRRIFRFLVVSALMPASGCALSEVPAQPDFTPIQQDLFDQPGGQAVVWADYDRDSDLDLAVGFKDGPVILYRQQSGVFHEVTDLPAIVRAQSDYRSLSWGDVDKDGWPDLYVGFGRDSGRRNLLLKNIAGKFVEEGAARSLDLYGTSRQASWIDYDMDGDSDLFVAMRDRNSKLLRNEGGNFTDVSRDVGLNDPRRSVGAVWFDFDLDGDLDLYLPNQSGDRDGLYRNDNGSFSDIAEVLNMDRARRPLREGSVGATLCDVNNDGNFDIFVPVYGRDLLYISNGRGGFTEQAQAWGVADPALAVSADCGDFDNDGKMDLYLVAYQRGEAHGYDRLYHNRGTHFVDVFPKDLVRFDGDHGVRFADFDNDGDLDIALTNRHLAGRHSVWRNNLLGSPRHNFLKIDVRDRNGNFTRQGDEIHVFDSGSGALIASHIVDTGGGYVSQSIQPVHIGLGSAITVDVEVKSMRASGRHVTRLKDVAANQTLTIQIAH